MSVYLVLVVILWILEDILTFPLHKTKFWTLCNLVLEVFAFLHSIRTPIWANVGVYIVHLGKVSPQTLHVFYNIKPLDNIYVPLEMVVPPPICWQIFEWLTHLTIMQAYWIQEVIEAFLLTNFYKYNT